jgi:hypothetical protein
MLDALKGQVSLYTCFDGLIHVFRGSGRSGAAYMASTKAGNMPRES